MADDRLIARVLRHHGGKLVNQAVSGAVDKFLPAEPAKPARSSFTGKIANALLLRVAMRSVPGAIIVGGGLIAKRLHERHKAQKKVKAEDK